MDDVRFELTGEQEQIRGMVRSLARKEFTPKTAEIDEKSRYPEENLKRLAELGLLGMLIPESHGGSDTGAVAYAIALAEVAGGCASTGMGMAVANMVGEAIYRFGISTVAVPDGDTYVLKGSKSFITNGRIVIARDLLGQGHR